MVFRLSDRDIAQKSWPSGAPSRAAAACIALTPGATSIERSRHAGSPRSTASKTAAAHCENTGIAARDDHDAPPLGGEASA